MTGDVNERCVEQLPQLMHLQDDLNLDYKIPVGDSDLIWPKNLKKNMVMNGKNSLGLVKQAVPSIRQQHTPS